MRFQKAYASRENCFSLGVETDSGLRYVAIPVSNQLVDYEEYYKITEEEFERFRGDPATAIPFVESCRNREQDHRLFTQPGSDRGVPR